jgi:hypothetical protein
MENIVNKKIADPCTTNNQNLWILGVEFAFSLDDTLEL